MNTNNVLQTVIFIVVLLALAPLLITCAEGRRAKFTL